MTAQAKQILEQALKLDARERLNLVAELEESLEEICLSDEWEAEIDRRIDDVDSGRVKTIPGDEVFARLEKRFGGK